MSWGRTAEPVEPGLMLWHDLQTPDVDAATAFYESLFGWQWSVWEEGGGDLQIHIHGDDYGGVFPAADTPSHWVPFISVPDAAETVERVRAAGGDVVEPPTAEPEFGRTALLADPSGARFGVLEPDPDTEWPGSRRRRNRLSDWNEVLATDVGRAGRFYAEVFGWETLDAAKGQAPSLFDLARRDAFLLLRDARRLRAGVRPRPVPLPRPAWIPYVVAFLVDETVERAVELGATVLVPPAPAPGRLERTAVLRDPAGAAFGLCR